MSKYYTIRLVGCDDTTEINLELKPAQFELLKQIADLSKQISTYGCMPTMEIGELKGFVRVITPTATDPDKETESTS